MTPQLKQRVLMRNYSARAEGVRVGRGYGSPQEHHEPATSQRMAGSRSRAAHRRRAGTDRRVARGCDAVRPVALLAACSRGAVAPPWRFIPRDARARLRRKKVLQIRPCVSVSNRGWKKSNFRRGKRCLRKLSFETAGLPAGTLPDFAVLPAIPRAPGRRFVLLLF